MDPKLNPIYKIAKYFESKKSDKFMHNWDFQQILSACLRAAGQGTLLQVCSEGNVVAAMIGEPKGEKLDIFYVISWACNSTECFEELLRMFFAQKRFYYVSGIHKNKERTYKAFELRRMQSLLKHFNKY